MDRPTPGRPAGSYGIDAVLVPSIFTAGALALLVLAVVNRHAAFLAWFLPVLGVVCLGGSAALFWHATLRGKFTAWGSMLDGLHLHGDEDALDLGCGRGAVVIATAMRLPEGHATGIDLWRNQDQTGNCAEATRRNAELNGVAERVSLDTGDMTQLPYANASFDLVTASVSIHNVPSAEGRRQAVREAWRVLRPGGHLVIADFGRIDDCTAALDELGVAFTRRGAGVQMLWGAFTPTTVIEATKA